MRNTFIYTLFFLIIFNVPLGAQNESDELRIEVGMKEGRLDGEYVSYYPYGQLKAKGWLKDNQPTGKWSVWDEEGHLKMTRVYHGPLEFEILFPTPETKGPAALFADNNFNMQRDSLGLNIQNELLDPNVYERRYVKTVLNSSDNSVIFNEGRLQEIIFERLQSDQKEDVIYDKTEFSVSDTIAKKEYLQAFDPTTQELFGFRIKEIQVFNIQRMITETYIIAFSPIIVNKGSTESLFNEFWLYYPYLRNHLASEKITLDNHPEIQNLEDVFQFKYFSSTIEQYSYGQNVILADQFSGEDLIEIQKRLAFYQYDDEHNLWIRLYHSDMKE